ncbi:hypothetical protein [Demequina sp. NBRC 110054]|uniref:hypothetical protein n=1 Tax=Demequina sp. NBRC 110054 TaxID=1570343 RepID=UPI00117825CC|nr:hypothetical protein [Demequina sp. NBRC 110054]
MASSTRTLLAKATSTALAAVALLGIGAVPATATEEGFTIGSTSLATPASGGRYIYVSTSGSDTVDAPNKTFSNGDPYPDIKRLNCLTKDLYPGWVEKEGWSDEKACPEPTAANPLATIKIAMQVAEAGDVIVVRGGTYYERLGYGIARGTEARPIVLQNKPGERVVVKGRMVLKGADYWTIDGLRWRWDKDATGSAMALVRFFGGTGWTFTHNDIRYTRGANLFVSAKRGADTEAERIAYAPHDYTISSNFIGYNLGTRAHRDHNIYLMASIWSSGGLITHNLLVSAPNGSNIKVAGSHQANESPVDVKITYNTMLGGQTGVVIGLKARKIVLAHNVIGLQVDPDRASGAVKTYRLRYPKSITVRDNVISGYNYKVREVGNVADDMHISVEDTRHWAVKYTGKLKGASIHFTWGVVERNYGHNAGW